MDVLEGISDRTPKSEKRDWDRLIPDGGVIVDHDGGVSLSYVDLNDLPHYQRRILHETIKSQHYPNDSGHIPKGIYRDRRFRVVVFKDGQPVIIYTLIEFLGGDYGYGKNDFLLSKFVYPEHVGGLVARYGAIDMMNITNNSGKMARIYGFNKEPDTLSAIPPSSFTTEVPVTPPTPPPASTDIASMDDENFLALNPCFSVCKEDGTAPTKVRTIDTEKGTFSIYERIVG